MTDNELLKRAMAGEIVATGTYQMSVVCREVERLRAALRQIANYGKDGICPYGCDTPYIASEALKTAGKA